MSMPYGDKVISDVIRNLNAEVVPYTQADIAQRAGCSLRTVSRTISRWKKTGKIEVTGSATRGYQYKILDHQVLS